MRHLRRLARSAVLALPIFILLSCSEPTTPTTPTGGASRSLLSLGTLTTLRRTEPVTEGLCASDVPVGPEGGVVECPEAGLRLTFPAGALADTVQVSVDVPDGNLVGYEFEPHGIQFARGVQLRQDLAGTEADGTLSLLSLLNGLEGAYVSRVSSQVDPLEILNLNIVWGLLGSPSAVTMTIHHFSGYVCATNYRASYR